MQQDSSWSAEEAEMTEKEFKENGTDTRKELRPGRVLMTLGLILVLGAGGITAYNLWDEKRAAAASDEVLTELLPEMPIDLPEQPAAEGTELADENRPIPSYLIHPEMEMPEVQVDGENSKLQEADIQIVEKGMLFRAPRDRKPL